MSKEKAKQAETKTENRHPDAHFLNNEASHLPLKACQKTTVRHTSLCIYHLPWTGVIFLVCSCSG